MDAFAEGREASRRGDAIDMNPYDEMDAQFDEWEDGWATQELGGER